MPVNVTKIIPKYVRAIGDDGKNKASNLFDGSLENHWSYKGKFAYNLITLDGLHSIDAITIHWYMKKKEIRKYDFGIYLSESEIDIPAEFEAAKNVVQDCYDSITTLKPLSNNGQDVSTIKIGGTAARSILIVYIKSSSKKDWFSVNEIIITASHNIHVGSCPDYEKWDSISQMCKPIVDDSDTEHGDDNHVLLFEDDGVEYISENHSYQKITEEDGSVSIGVGLSDMGNKTRPDKEFVVFVRCLKADPKGFVTARFDGGEIFGVSMDSQIAIWQQQVGEQIATREELNIANMRLNQIVNNWYGLCFRDRRILRKGTGELMGRLLQIKMNSNPYDYNRNVLNSNWIDVTAFLDKGSDIMDGPSDVESIRLEGSNAVTYGIRYPRFCGIAPIYVEDEKEMDRVLREARNEEDIDEDVEPPKAMVKAPLIVVKERDTMITMDASDSGEGLMYKWKQISGAPIELSPMALTSPVITFEWRPEYSTSEFQVSVTNDKGLTTSNFVKVLNEINENPEGREYIAKVYNDNILAQDKYVKTTADLVFSSERQYKNVELTIHTDMGKKKDDSIEVHLRNRYLVTIKADGTFYVPENSAVFQYLSAVPVIKGKRIGLKYCLQTTWANEEKIALLQVLMTLDLTVDKYMPWFSVIFKGENIVEDEAEVTIKSSSDKDYLVEIREIQALPFVTSI